MDKIKLAIAKSIAKILEKEEKQVFDTIEKPKTSSMGDFAYPCFRLAGEYKKAPFEIANGIKEKLGEIDGVSKIEVVAGYINFFADNNKVISEVVKEILDKQDECLV